MASWRGIHDMLRSDARACESERDCQSQRAAAMHAHGELTQRAFSRGIDRPMRGECRYQGFKMFRLATRDGSLRRLE